MAFDPLTAALSLGEKVIDKIFPDPAQRDQAKLEMLKMQQSGELDTVKIQMSAIIAEAQSADPWTSRARPGFMYLFYLVVVCLVIIAPVAGIFFPGQMEQFYRNVAEGFKAIPDIMWQTFGVGYLGYVAARQYGKVKGSDK